MSGARSRGPRVVVGYDGSEAARAAVTWAAARAGRAGKVWIVHSLEPGAPGQGKAVLDALLLEGGNALLDVDYELELAVEPLRLSTRRCMSASVSDLQTCTTDGERRRALGQVAVTRRLTVAEIEGAHHQRPDERRQLAMAESVAGNAVAAAAVVGPCPVGQLVAKASAANGTTLAGAVCGEA